MEIIKSEKGFLTVTLLALLPLLIAVGVALSFSSRLLFQWHQTHKICRSESMGLQNQLGMLLKSLLLLNPQAHKLRLDKIATAAKLAMAVANANPPAITLYTAKLKMIQAKQAQLDRQQKLILATAKTRLIKWQVAMSLKLRTKIQGPLRLESSNREALAVEPWPKGALAPTYRTKENFAQQQMVGATWAKPIRGECFATLQQRRLSWKPVLSEAKSLWK